MRTTIHRNGQPPAPPSPSGAASIGTTQTVFPTEDTPLTFSSLLYLSQRANIAGIRPARALWGLGAAVILLWLPGWLPGGVWVSIAVALALVAITVSAVQQRRRDYVSFTPTTAPTSPPAPLAPEDKVGVYVTGRLSVEGRDQRYTWLPGFYRTFATREHALMCLCHPTHGRGVTRWPEEELGLWYAFFRPDQILRTSWGSLHYGRHARPAIAVDFEQVVENPRKTRQRTIQERIYLAFTDEASAHLVWTDLLWDGQRTRPDGEIKTAQQTSSPEG